MKLRRLIFLVLAAGAVGFLFGRQYGQGERGFVAPPTRPQHPSEIERGEVPPPARPFPPQTPLPPPAAAPEDPPPAASTPAAAGDLYAGSLIHTPRGALKVVVVKGEYRLVRHGRWIETDDKGTRVSDVEYRDGVLDGPAVYSHANGSPKEQGDYVAGKKHGLWITWDEQGSRLGEEEWANGLPAAFRITDETLLTRASVGGKYRTFSMRVYAPDDEKSYGEYRDFGKYGATDYKGVKSIPAGFWVYVEPYWYIWLERAR